MIVFAYENANYYNPLILSIQRSYPSGAISIFVVETEYVKK